MAFYGRSRLDRWSLGALPSFAVPGDLDSVAQGVLNTWLSSTPPGSPAGNIRQLIAKANEVQIAAAPAFAHPSGSTAASNAASLEASLAQGWLDLVENARKTSEANRRLANVPNMNDLLGSPLRPGWPADPTMWDINHANWLADVARVQGEIDRIVADRDARLGPALGEKLVQYVTSVSEAAKAVQRLIDAERNKKTAEVVAATAKTEGEALVAQTKNVRAQTELIVAKKEAAKAASKIGGVSPVLLAAGLLGAGAIAYFATRKRGSVAGYRRRRSR